MDQPARVRLAPRGRVLPASGEVFAISFLPISRNFPNLRATGLSRSRHESPVEPRRSCKPSVPGNSASPGPSPRPNSLTKPRRRKNSEYLRKSSPDGDPPGGEFSDFLTNIENLKIFLVSSDVFVHFLRCPGFVPETEERCTSQIQYKSNESSINP